MIGPIGYLNSCASCLINFALMSKESGNEEFMIPGETEYNKQLKGLQHYIVLKLFSNKLEKVVQFAIIAEHRLLILKVW